MKIMIQSSRKLLNRSSFYSKGPFFPLKCFWTEVLKTGFHLRKHWSHQLRCLWLILCYFSVDGGSATSSEQSVRRKKEREEARKWSHHCTSVAPNQLEKEEWATLEEFDIIEIEKPQLCSKQHSLITRCSFDYNLVIFLPFHPGAQMNCVLLLKTALLQ